jgi:hypothetical protein
MGPGDPDFLTVKAMRVLEHAPVLVHFCKRGKRGNARTIADAVMIDPTREFPLAYPYTTELHPDHPPHRLHGEEIRIARPHADAVERTGFGRGGGLARAVRGLGRRVDAHAPLHHSISFASALFRLLELLDEGVAPPAAVIGIPVGFVGAAESKEALARDGRVPFVVVHGRRGGSAMTAAAVNALANEIE